MALAVAVFIAAWLGLYSQMVEGKDPSLSPPSKQVGSAWSSHPSPTPVTTSQS